MKTIGTVSMLAVLLTVAPRPCFAEWSFGPVSKERTKELGMEIRSKAKGANQVSVELEIKAEDELKTIDRGDLRHRETIT